MTRVDFEHRNLERMGPRGPQTRLSLDSQDGWGGILALFATVAES
jgi:hypothetical protein